MMNAARRVCAGPKTWMMHTMSDKTHEGWSNYKTWAVALWLTTDRKSSPYWCEQAKRHHDEAPTCQMVVDGVWSAEEAEKYNLAEQLKQEIEANAPEALAGAYSDLLHAGLGDVNWREIAAEFLLRVHPESPTFGPIISVYTRAQAIADGVLVDVSEMAREAGIKHPTALTSAVWSQYVQVPEGVEAQDEVGRLWDILNMFRFAAKESAGGGELLFRLLVRNDNFAPALVTLKALCGPGDTPAPVITILLPNQD